MSELRYHKIGKYEIAIDGIQGWKSDDYHGDGGIIISWGAKGVGFGTLTFYYKNGRLKADEECMSPEFSRAVLEAMYLEATQITPEEMHAIGMAEPGPGR